MLIVTGSDDNYVPGVLVLIASAAFHNPKTEFAVLGMNISDANKDRIRQLGERLNVPINLVEVSDSHFEHYPVRRSHLTRGAFLRLLIPELFPDRSRAVYMDCDMVVMGDLSELDTIDLEGIPVAAVPCPDSDPAELESIGVPHDQYFNSGLLVMNIPVWNELEISKKSVDLLLDESLTLLYEDQSALNMACFGKAVLLPTTYNVYSTISAYKSTSGFPMPPVVIHYVVNNKPWKVLAEFGEIWHFHADRIADLMPPRTASRRGFLSDLNFRRKKVTEALSPREKYRLRRKMRAWIKSEIITPYLQKVA